MRLCAVGRASLLGYVAIDGLDGALKRIPESTASLDDNAQYVSLVEAKAHNLGRHLIDRLCGQVPAPHRHAACRQCTLHVRTTKHLGHSDGARQTAEKSSALRMMEVHGAPVDQERPIPAPDGEPHLHPGAAAILTGAAQFHFFAPV